jgi:radical SAM superfamily enzyme YgiQ (UPF0313 family)
MFLAGLARVARLIRLARQRFPSIPIVAGGEHITAVPDFTLESTPEVDACAIGEGEETIVDLANAIERGASFDGIPGLVIRSDGGTRSTGPRARIRKSTTSRCPRGTSFRSTNYLDHGLGYGVDRGRSMPMLATRGCPYECTFCSNPEMWTTRWIARNPNEGAR